MKRATTALLAGGAVFVGATAFAASLGGIDTQNLGADDQVVASCDIDGVGVEYNVSYDGTNGKYEVDSVDVTGINDDCLTETVSVTLVDGAGNVLSEASSTVTSGVSNDNSSNVDVSADDVDAELVERVNVLITPDASTSA